MRINLTCLGQGGTSAPSRIRTHTSLGHPSNNWDDGFPKNIRAPTKLRYSDDPSYVFLKHNFSFLLLLLDTTNYAKLINQICGVFKTLLQQIPRKARST